MIHVITYDLHQPGRHYAAVEKAIDDTADSWAHPQGSVWLVDTLLTTSKWRDLLKAAGDPNDEYLVMRIWTDHWASWNMDQEVADWLKNPQRRW
jgi:hypothetical protein